MHQHSGLADVELVLLLDLQIIHPVLARLQADRLKRDRLPRRRAEALADPKFASRHPILPGFAIEAVRRRGLQDFAVGQAKFEHRAAGGGERAGDDPPTPRLDLRAGLDGEHVGGTVDAQFGKLETDLRADHRLSLLDPGQRTQQFDIHQVVAARRASPSAAAPAAKLPDRPPSGRRRAGVPCFRAFGQRPLPDTKALDGPLANGRSGTNVPAVKHTWWKIAPSGPPISTPITPPFQPAITASVRFAGESPCA